MSKIIRKRQYFVRRERCAVVVRECCHFIFKCCWFLAILCALSSLLFAQGKPRARDLGVPFDGVPGTLNANDAPLISTQLKRLAKRVSLGLGRNGSFSGDGSGDIFIAFSTANPHAADPHGLRQLTMLPNDQINSVFLATVQATEEAIVNAMIAAETMTGVNGHTVIALPHDQLQQILAKYHRLEKK